MTAMIDKNNRAGESGNVLFLILIAVALFAALSYAVTQSTRSGSGDASGETNLINSAQLAQYPAGVRTAVVRMIIGGTAVESLGFDAPSEFDTVSDLDYNVFHPTGGGAVFQNAPQDVLASQSGVDPADKGKWIFSSQYQIDGIGATDNAASGSYANDIIAFLPGVAQNVCKKLNDEVGITASTDDKIPESVGITVVPTPAEGMTEDAPGTQGIPTGAPTATIAGDLVGQPFGCFRIGAASATPANKTFVYYHVLVER